MMTKYLSQTEEFFLKDAERATNSLSNGGLYNGQTGIAIVYYLLAKEYSNQLFAEKGLHLLEWVSENGISGENICFSDGLSGIGWTIEWLAQNELMEDIETDEILAPVDKILYTAVSYDKDKNPTLSSGTLGKIAYFSKRAVRHNVNTSRFKTIGHLECLVLLLDDLADKTNGEISLSDLGQILISISALKIKVNTPTTGNILYSSVNAAARILSDAVIHSGNYLDHFYLAVSYLIAARNMDNINWEAQAVQHIDRIVAAIDDRDMLTIKQMFQKLITYSLLYAHIPNQLYQNEIEQLITTLSSMDLPPTFVNGRGTLVMAELCLTNPKLIKHWHEVMLFDKQL